MRTIGDVIEFPDHVVYDKHRGHTARVTDADSEYAEISCSCGDVWLVAQNPGDLESEDE